MVIYFRSPEKNSASVVFILTKKILVTLLVCSYRKKGMRFTINFRRYFDCV